MRILALADKADERLWGMLDKRLLEGVDLILSAGDLPAEYLSFLTCFTKAPVLYIHGNHDVRYAKNPPEGCVCIEDTVYTYDGIRILGLGGSYRYKPGPCMYTEREMCLRLMRLKLRRQLRKAGGFDILLTHAPARGIGDQEHISHRGFEVFLKLMDRYHPKYLIHGHIHREYTAVGFQRERQYGSTTVVNASNRVYIDI
ncbi:MAG: metallophosphoesterase [Clostridia bacterium]|nr:metallophosphoesterase [Clostridia bacterium]